MTSFTERIKEAIRDDRVFEISEPFNFGILFELGDDLLAKVFDSQCHADAEFRILERIAGLDDERIVAPAPYDLVDLGNTTVKGLYESDIKRGNLHAVVMDLLRGTCLSELPDDQKPKYTDSARSLRDALLEHEILKWDLKPREIICLSGSEQVGIVDFHAAEIDPVYGIDMGMRTLKDQVADRYQEVLIDTFQG